MPNKVQSESGHCCARNPPEKIALVKEALNSKAQKATHFCSTAKNKKNTQRIISSVWTVSFVLDVFV